MNIVWVSLYPPLPLNFGGPIGIYHKVKEISRKNNIFLFYLCDEDPSSYETELSLMCREVHGYKRERKISLSLLLDFLRYPYTVATRKTKVMSRDISDCIRRHSIDILLVEFPQMCINLPHGKRQKKLPIVLNEHNNEWDRFAQMSASVKGIRRLLFQRESYKLHQFEKKLERAGRIDCYAFLSAKDRKRMIQDMHIPASRTFLAPLGGEEQVIDTISHQGKNFMFIAAMDGETNEEAVLWFCQSVLPLFRDKNVKFYVIGRNPSSRVQALTAENIVVTGAVESLIPYYALADAIVIPLLHGGGVKVKLMEAVGHGKNVITTSVGAEGTMFTEEDLWIGDRAEELAAFCRKVIEEDPELVVKRKHMMETFRKYYSWDKIGDAYENHLKKTIKQRTG
jgi:glycosyltransferase involved in cell wall biosynthesis